MHKARTLQMRLAFFEKSPKSMGGWLFETSEETVIERDLTRSSSSVRAPVNTGVSANWGPISGSLY